MVSPSGHIFCLRRKKFIGHRIWDFRVIHHQIFRMSQTTIVLISHQSPPEVAAMCQTWQRLNPEARIHVAYGGTPATFEALDWPYRSLILDPRLRTRDHQRERQSYLGIMQTMVAELDSHEMPRILLVECDLVPLRTGLADYLAGRAEEECADVLGVKLRRADGTSHPHFLAHQGHSEFQNWLGQSIREDREVVLMVLGCLTWWTWEAFCATALAPEPLPVYLELAMPTTAHHLGFRVRNLAEFESDIEPSGELEGSLEQRLAEGRWLVHPCKRIWLRGSWNAGK